MIRIICSLLILVTSLNIFAGQVRIVDMTGKVQVRHGLDVEWKNAAVGALLEDLDTILTGERGEVVLELADQGRFTLSSNSMLDIADLRKITEKELFLYLTRQKINRIEPRDERQKINLTRVTVIHGESKDSTTQGRYERDPMVAAPAKNGIRALYHQGYYPNTIIKLDRMFAEGNVFGDCGEFHYYLGHSLEEVTQHGKALDTYRELIKQYSNDGCSGFQWVRAAREAEGRLTEE